VGKAVVALATTASLAFSTSAFGAILVPPGKSGANQYFENIPSAQGSSAPPTYGRSAVSPPSAIAALGRGRAGTAALARLGKDGQAAATLAQETAPAPARGTGRGAGGPSGRGASPHPVAIPAVTADSPASAVSHALGGSGGLGALLPILLVASLLAAIAAGVWRLRHGSGPTQPSL